MIIICLFNINLPLIGTLIFINFNFRKCEPIIIYMYKERICGTVDSERAFIRPLTSSKVLAFDNKGEKGFFTLYCAHLFVPLQLKIKG